MADEPQKTKHLEEHLPYELAMLRYCFKQLHTAAERDYSAYIESFCIHARILKEFLGNKAEAGNLKACDYDDGFEWKPPNRLFGAFQKIGPQITHLSQRRPTGSTHKKFTFANAQDVFAWLEPTFCEFIKKLTPHYQSYWNDSEAPRISQLAAYAALPLPLNNTTTTLATGVTVVEIIPGKR